MATAADRHRPTGHDVARAAGVSQATVSLVLGGKSGGRVSERTAAAVRAAAERLGYRPNGAARDLRTGRPRTVLLAVPALTNEFFAGVYEGAARSAAEHGNAVLLYSAPQRAPVGAPGGAAVRGTPLAGVVASSMAVGPSSPVAALREPGVPLVLLDSAPGSGFTTVNSDVADGMRQVMAHLLGLGHRRLCHLAADVEAWTFRERAAAVDAAAAGHGAGVRVRRLRSALTVAAGEAAARRALTDGAPADRPTALVCDDDIIAAGALKAARRLGLAVPGQVSVTGFDDIALATAVEPELTTVRLDPVGMGERGVTALFRDADTAAVLPVALVARGSTGPAR